MSAKSAQRQKALCSDLWQSALKCTAAAMNQAVLEHFSVMQECLSLLDDFVTSQDQAEVLRQVGAFDAVADKATLLEMYADEDQLTEYGNCVLVFVQCTRSLLHRLISLRVEVRFTRCARSRSPFHQHQSEPCHQHQGEPRGLFQARHRRRSMCPAAFAQPFGRSCLSRAQGLRCLLCRAMKCHAT